jgi:hypothetical protein
MPENNYLTMSGKYPRKAKVNFLLVDFSVNKFDEYL